MTHFAAEG